MHRVEQKSLDSYYVRNTIGISLVEFLWGLGLPVVVESTFLQLFLRNLGASSFIIGLIPTFFSIGMSCSGILSAFLTSHMESKRRAVILTHIAGAIPLPVFGIVFLITGSTSSTLVLFLIVYALFSIAIGVISPTWLNYIVKIFTEKRSVSALGIMMMAQNFTKLLCGLLLVNTISRFSFSPVASGIIFILVGAFFLIGSFMFLITRECLEKTAETGRKKLSDFSKSFRKPLRNKRFLFYLASDTETYAIVGVLSFYANYATEFCRIPAAFAGGLFMAVNYLGGICINVLLGWVGLLSLRNKLIFSKLTSFCAVLLLIFIPSLWAFLLASFILGSSRAIRGFVYALSIKKLSGEKDATHYFSIAPFFTLPFSVGIPLASGKFLDATAKLGGDSYRLMFAAMAVIILASLFFLLKTNLSDSTTKQSAEG